MIGFRWSLIAGRLPGRTDNEIKNYWNTHIKRKLLTRGLDPQTHRPLNEAGSATATATTDAAATSRLDFRNGSPPFLSVEKINSLMDQTNFKNNSNSTTNHHNNKILLFKPKKEEEYMNNNNLEEANCTSSGTTTEEDQHQHQKPDIMYKCGDLNLDLSIGLEPFQSEPTRASSGNSAESKPTQRTPNNYELFAQAAAVCLCCQVGFQSSEACRSCQCTNGFYRFHRPLNS